MCRDPSTPRKGVKKGVQKVSQKVVILGGPNLEISGSGHVGNVPKQDEKRLGRVFGPSDPEYLIHWGYPFLSISDTPFPGVCQGWWAVVNTEMVVPGIMRLVRLNPWDPSWVSPCVQDPPGPPKRWSKRGPKKGPKSDDFGGPKPWNSWIPGGDTCP